MNKAAEQMLPSRPNRLWENHAEFQSGTSAPCARSGNRSRAASEVKIPLPDSHRRGDGGHARDDDGNDLGIMVPRDITRSRRSMRFAQSRAGSP
jgi:hypothetical protein